MAMGGLRGVGRLSETPLRISPILRYSACQHTHAQDYAVAGRFRSGANSEYTAALDKLREEVAAQQSQIAVQSARIGDLQATAKQQDARIGDLTRQLQELEAQAQWQRPAPARPAAAAIRNPGAPG